MNKYCSSCSHYQDMYENVGCCTALGIVQGDDIVILDNVNILIELKKNDNIHTPIFIQGRFGCVWHSNRKNETL